MLSKQTLTFGVAGGAFAAWIAGAAMNTRDMPVVHVAKPTPIELQGAALQAEIFRLRERLRPTSTPQRGRNLFDFAGSGRPRVDTLEGDAARAPAQPPPAARPPVPPSLALIGLAEDRDGDRLVRTAIVSGFGDVFLLKEGEAVGTRYSVASIRADGVVLTDAEDGSTITLHLK
jgi:hypothetical protein